MPFKVDFTSDAFDLTVNAGKNFLVRNGFTRHFEGREYGIEFGEIFMVFMCSVEEFQQRRRIDRRDRVFYHDIMLPPFRMVFSPPEERIRIHGACIREQLAVALRGYRFNPAKFDSERFLTDLDAWLNETRMLKLTRLEAEPYAELSEKEVENLSRVEILRQFGIQHDKSGKILSTPADLNRPYIEKIRRQSNDPMWQDKLSHYPGWPEDPDYLNYRR